MGTQSYQGYEEEWALRCHCLRAMVDGEETESVQTVYSMDGTLTVLPFLHEPFRRQYHTVETTRTVRDGSGQKHCHAT